MKTPKITEADLDAKIARIRAKNEVLMRRHHEVEEDIKAAEESGYSTGTKEVTQSRI